MKPNTQTFAGKIGNRDFFCSICRIYRPMNQRYILFREIYDHDLIGFPVKKIKKNPGSGKGTEKTDLKKPENICRVPPVNE